MKDKGFTLVELLAVIVILGIIALIGYSSIGNIIEASSIKADKLTVKEYAKAVEESRMSYLMETGEDIAYAGNELSSEWISSNVKFDKSNVVCNKVTYNSTVKLYECTVNDGERTYCLINEVVEECTANILSKIYGNSVQNGTPIPTSPVDVISLGEKSKNLLEYPYLFTSKTSNGVTATVNSDGSVTLNGTATGDTFFKLKGSEFHLPSGTYIMNGYMNSHIMLFASPNGGHNYYNQPFTITDTDGVFVYITSKNGEAYNNETFYPQIEPGIEITPYDPYGYKIPITLSNGTTSNTSNIYIDEPLRKVGDVADYIDFETGKLVRNIGKIDSYNAEIIATDYISTTGSLTTGATVYYQLTMPMEKDIIIPIISVLEGNITYTIGTSIQPSNIEYNY